MQTILIWVQVWVCCLISCHPKSRLTEFNRLPRKAMSKQVVERDNTDSAAVVADAAAATDSTDCSKLMLSLLPLADGGGMQLQIQRAPGSRGCVWLNGTKRKGSMLLQQTRHSDRAVVYRCTSFVYQDCIRCEKARPIP